MKLPARAASLFGITAAVALAGCGSDGSEATELAAGLPEDARTVAVADFADLRDSLGLDDDHDISVLPDDFEIGSPEAQILNASAFTLPQVRVLVTNFDDEDPLLGAIDGSQITAAASSVEPDVAIVESDQPFEEVAEALSGEGFEENDGVLVASEDLTASAGAIAERDGGFVVAESAELASAAAEGSGEGPAVAALLDAVEGPFRASFPLDGSECLEAVAFGEDLAEASGSVAVEVDGEADAQRLSVDELDPESAEESEADAGVASATYTYSADENPDGVAIRAIQGFVAPRLYECP